MRIASLLVVFSTGLITYAQTPNRLAEIPARMQKFVDSNDLSGAVTVSGNAKEIVHIAAVGKADIAKNKPMTEDTIFRIASMTKPITALAIMILQDEGKLSVDDAVEKHLPEFKGQMMVEKKDSASITLKKPARPITLRDLLTHTSGLPNYSPGIADVYTKRNRTLAETTIAISQRPLEFEPGSKWSYCNPGIDTLGRVVEVVSGIGYEKFLRTRIFDPLGMTDTTFYPTAAQLERLAVIYAKKDGKLEPSGNLIIDITKDAKHPIPAGGLFSTGRDLAKLYQSMLMAGVWNGKRIVSDGAIRQMTQTQTGDIKTGFTDGMSFGFGWAVVKEPKGVTEKLSAGTFGHGGAFGTQAWVDPVKKRFDILLIQRTGLPNSDASPMRKALHELTAAP
jgi:CubicO group peptidase (beta-lactamase class C family)